MKIYRIGKWQIVPKSILILILFVGLVELSLRIVDPLGALRYYSDLARILNAFIATPNSYQLYPATYTLSDWQATVLADGTRSTPASKPAACTIAFIGDSGTFGLGVSDDYPFPNLIAGAIEAHVINAGVPGYSSYEILQSIHTYPADGYVYLLISNDDDVARRVTATTPPPYAGYHVSAIQTYLRSLRRYPAPLDRPRFERDMREIARRADVLPVLMQDSRNWYQGVLPLLPDALIIPYYTERISATDPHPSRAGHAQIARAILPHVQAFAARVC